LLINLFSLFPYHTYRKQMPEPTGSGWNTNGVRMDRSKIKLGDIIFCFPMLLMSGIFHIFRVAGAIKYNNTICDIWSYPSNILVKLWRSLMYLFSACNCYYHSGGFAGICCGGGIGNTLVVCSLCGHNLCRYEEDNS
jgi:hypothetical protein